MEVSHVARHSARACVKCRKPGHSARSMLMLGCWAGGVGPESVRAAKGCVLACAPQVAGRTNDAAGDGTTTASVLAREMIHYGLQVGGPFPACHAVLGQAIAARCTIHATAAGKKRAIHQGEPLWHGEGWFTPGACRQ